MKGIITPKTIIYHTVVDLIKLIRSDLSTATDDQDTILYALLGTYIDGKPIQMNGYNWFTQAKAMFTNIKNLKVTFGYEQNVSKLTSICILLPRESYDGSYVGAGEGSNEETNYPNDGIVTTDMAYEQWFDSDYQVMISSENSSEVEVIYEVLKSCFLMVTQHWELMGMRLPKISGQDIVFSQDEVPAGLFHKVLNINFKYELTVPQLLKKTIITRLHASGSLITGNYNITK